jgi:hypothetical protein
VAQHHPTLAAAEGRWPEILAALAGLTAEQLTPSTREIPCPHCGGTDRYRWVSDAGDGGCCGDGGPSDSLSAILKVGDAWDLVLIGIATCQSTLLLVIKENGSVIYRAWRFGSDLVING